MKAITLWQPWASLLACGANQFETRSWKTSYRGPIAIHAARKPFDLSDFAIFDPRFEEAATDALREAQISIQTLPYSCVIAMAELIGCHLMRSYIDEAAEIVIQTNGGECLLRAGENEYLFGDWAPGRYAWEFANMQMLDEPIPAKGRQGLWNWEECQ